MFFLKVNKSTATVSTTISLLSTLCRGSEAITHNLLRSNLAEAIESALQGDERCTLDTMRLIDLLLVLLFEGKFFLYVVIFVTTINFFSCYPFWQPLWITRIIYPSLRLVPSGNFFLVLFFVKKSKSFIGQLVHND